MYSIEYNQVNENGHAVTQETDFYNNPEQERPGHHDPRPAMTPRRVKRRSYTRNSARSAGKALKKDNHRQSGRSIKSASGALGALNKKSINPVTRLMQETAEPRLINDSSTSNDDNRVNPMERYGQVNPGYVSSRPNSLYSQAVPAGNNHIPQSITDYEASRPPSALTSYSNFHGQRRPAMGQKLPHNNMMSQLTQESLNPYEDKGAVPKNTQYQGQNLGPNNPMNASFDDDLPPPPPPLSSSPTPGGMGHQGQRGLSNGVSNGFSNGLSQNGEDTDNNSSITTDTTAQVSFLALSLNRFSSVNAFVSRHIV